MEEKAGRTENRVASATGFRVRLTQFNSGPDAHGYCRICREMEQHAKDSSPLKQPSRNYVLAAPTLPCYCLRRVSALKIGGELEFLCHQRASIFFGSREKFKPRWPLIYFVSETVWEDS